jgi:hypothetical protein
MQASQLRVDLKGSEAAPKQNASEFNSGGGLLVIRVLGGAL